MKKSNSTKSPNLAKRVLANRFNIDFFEFSFLVEACIPPRPIARAMFWDDVINKHYHVLTENERQRLFEWINRCDNFTYNLPKNEDCQLFNARFDKENQYTVETKYNSITENHRVFKWQGKYHISKTQSVNEDYIVEITKVSETVC
jgi:hypothetical protein